MQHKSGRKISVRAAEAFLSLQTYREGNTIVDGGCMRLHRMPIALSRGGDYIIIYPTGYGVNARLPSQVTLERLNTLLEIAHGKRMLFIRRGKLYFGSLACEVDTTKPMKLPRYISQEVEA